MPEMHYPDFMKRQSRWLVRRTGSKQPRSPLAECPAEYLAKPGANPGAWRWAWNQLCICVGYAEAAAFIAERRKKYEGLSYVVHPGGEAGVILRLICLDFDRAFDDQGEILPEIAAVLSLADSFVEYSRSGKGLHLFVLVRCDVFTNMLQRKLTVEGTAAVDVLCSSQVAVTGEVFENYRELREVSFDWLSSLPFFKPVAPAEMAYHDFRDWWLADHADLSPEHEPIVEEMTNWTEAIKDHGRSNTTLAAACQLMRRGVTGWQAVELLSLVPTEPALTEAELIHKIESAYRKVLADGSFAGGLPEFDQIEAPDIPDSDDSEGIKAIDEGGWRIYTVAELDKLDVSLDFVIDGVMVDRQAMFVGGREKCFKTGIACDLLLSLATGLPFLGRFPVLHTRRCLFLTGEIGVAPAQDLIRRIRDSKGIEGGTVENMLVGGFVPNFTDKEELARLGKIFRQVRPQVVCFDPLYFCLGNSAVGDMYEIGRVLREITIVCERYQITPIFCHHAKKDATKDGSPMQLSDLYGAGVAAFARQWILLSHATPFGAGAADLHATLGSSSKGDLGQWRLKIDEGQLDELVDRRHWAVKMEKSEDTRSSAETEILDLITKSSNGLDSKSIEACTCYKPREIKVAIARLIRDGSIAYQGDQYVAILGG